MKQPLALAFILGCSVCLTLLVSCSDASYITPAMTFAYDDFGSEATASSLLGPNLIYSQSTHKVGWIAPPA